MACPKCSYANDESFKCCKQCGYARRSAAELGYRCSGYVRPRINEETISQRLDELARQRSSSRYAKQKSSLENELVGFLCSLSTLKSLASALPSDIVVFLIWKHKGGKTWDHRSQCLIRARGGCCDCPKRLAFGTVDALIGKLRAIFAAHDRGTEWQPLLGVGNPAAGRVAKNYLADVREEQQAEPVLLADLEVISRHIHSKLLVPSSLEPAQTFILARDQAVFKALFLSGDRAADLLQLKTADVWRFPDNSGLLLNHVWTKTLRSGDKNVLAFKRGSNKTVCPVASLELYVRLCNLLSVDLGSGYIFRSLSKEGKISSRGLEAAAAQSRLNLYSAELRGQLSNERFTLRGFRSGSEVSLTLADVDLNDIMDHMHYIKLKQVVTRQALLHPDTGKVYKSLDCFKEFSQAF